MSIGRLRDSFYFLPFESPALREEASHNVALITSAPAVRAPVNLRFPRQGSEFPPLPPPKLQSVKDTLLALQVVSLKLISLDLKEMGVTPLMPLPP